MDSQASNSPDLHFLPDQPTSQDQLNIHRRIADRLKTFVRGDLPKPLVIGLFGPWGSGKSSIIKMMEDADDRTFKIVVVDAWRKDRKNFLRQFIKKLAREILQEGSDTVCKKVDFKKSTQEVNWVPGERANIYFCIYLLVALLVLFGTIYSWYFYPDYPSKEIAGVAFIMLGVIFLQYLLPRFSKQIHVSTEDITIEDPARFREIYFQDILEKASGLSICIVIDNLDRVPPEDATGIIKLMKTFIVDVDYENVSKNKTKITFLIPCDVNELESRLFEQRPAASKQFLQKFINISLQIPALLQQDNISYIRGLIEQTGLQCGQQSLDNLAFIISRASRDNPRRPKVIINHFVARYNLAKAFPDCWKYVVSKPDWYAIFTVMEFEGYPLPEYIEQLRSPAYTDSTNPDHFVTAVAPIIAEISAEAWHAFKYLKKSNFYELVPGFKEMVNYAQERNFSEFNKIFTSLLSDRPSLISELWNENSDNQSQMALAEMILSAYEKAPPKKLLIPKFVLIKIGHLIRSTTTGFSHLPAEPTYELILKNDDNCLNTVVVMFSTSTFNTADGRNLIFMRNILRLTMQAGKFSNEIVQILDTRGKTDTILARYSIIYPGYKSIAAFQTYLDDLLLRNSTEDFNELIKYLADMANTDRDYGVKCLTNIENSVFPRLSSLDENNVHYIKMFFVLVRLRERVYGLFAGNRQTVGAALNQITGQFDMYVHNGLWEHAMYAYLIVFDLSQSGEVSIQHSANSYYMNMAQKFKKQAPQEFLDRASRYTSSPHEMNVFISE